jgi:succinyl-CoA synthetase beta subunit
MEVKIPIVIRLVGTNEEEGRRVLQESGMDFTAENSLPDAAKKVVELSS